MLEYVSPSMTGRGLDPGVEDALSSFGGSLQYLVDEINWELDQLRNVQIPGEGTVSLQQLFDGTAAWAEAMFVPSGAMMLFNGTLAEAYELPGWYVMDGRYTDDLLGRYLRASALGDDAGCTGGSNTHSHDAATGAKTETTSLSVTGGGHCHTGSTIQQTTDTCILVCEQGSTQVPPYNHTHSATNTGTEVGGTHTHSISPNPHQHDISATFELDASANEPAYWAGIPIQKI
jgi:hypothetical protein